MISNFYKSLANYLSNSVIIARYFDSSLTSNWIGASKIKQLHDRFIISVNPNKDATIDDRIGDLIAYGKILNSNGIELIADLLGEDLIDKGKVHRFVLAYQKIAKSLNQNKIKGYISLKGSMLGQALNYDGINYNVDDKAINLFYNNMLEILKVTGKRFVRMDAENIQLLPSYYLVYEKLRSDGYNNIGIVLQANVKKSIQILESLAHLKPNIRLVKGAYRISGKEGFEELHGVDCNYRKLMKHAKKLAVNIQIATHDEKIIRYALRNNYTAFEFLKGIADHTKKELVLMGKKVSDYGPVDLMVGGKSYWFKYFTRRIGEHPANLFFILKHL